MNSERFQDLMDIYADGALDPDQKAELQKSLEVSEEYRRLFWKAMRHHALIRSVFLHEMGQECAEAGGARDLPRKRSSARLRRRRRAGRSPAFILLLAAACLAVVIGLLILLEVRDPSGSSNKSVEQKEPQQPRKDEQSPRSDEQYAIPDGPDTKVVKTPGEPKNIVKVPPKDKEKPEPKIVVVKEQDSQPPERGRDLANITRTWGAVSLKQGHALAAGERLVTNTGLAELKSGDALIYVNGDTKLTLREDRNVLLVDLAKGEIYVQDGGKQRVIVETPDGQFTPLGTRYDVRIGAGKTILTVEQGNVSARAKGNAASQWVNISVRVEGGFASEVRKGAAPAAPRRSADLKRIVKWVDQIRIGRGRGRITEGVVALYAFQEGEGSVIRDVSGTGNPLNLTIETPDGAVRWLKGGGLAFEKPAMAVSSGPAAKIISACRRSNEITIEAWVKPLDVTQAGPARIVTLSGNSATRNFTLGMNGSREDTPLRHYIARLRTTKTTIQGTHDLIGKTPLIASRKDSAEGRVTHVVFTRNAGGIMRMYVNGVEHSRGKTEGVFSGWDAGYRLALANELQDVSGDEGTPNGRNWTGEYHLIALYSRALSTYEVKRNFAAGTGRRGQ